MIIYFTRFISCSYPCFLQIHRRARALSRLANGDVIKQFSSNILMNYIKVFADVFLFDHSSADSDVLLTSAVEVNCYL